MPNLWNKVKQTLEQSTVAIKKTTDSVSKTVAEKTPQIVSAITDKSKDIAVSVSDKTQELVTLGQLKIKHYNLNRDVSNLFTEIGKKTHELNGEKIYLDPGIQEMIEKIKNLEKNIREIEDEMKQTQSKTATEDEAT